MRPFVLALALAAVAAPLGVSAQPRPAPRPITAPAPAIATVDVTIGGKLARDRDNIGRRDLDQLALSLRRTVERQLARDGRLSRSGGRLELVITDAKPNRPTMEQMSRKPGLSLRSRGVGGATIEGFEVTRQGRRPISFSWYETDFRNTRGAATWTDAERAFDLFARDYARGRR